MTLQPDKLDRFLARAETAIALLDRCRPLNGRSELERVVAGWERGIEATPAWRYGQPPDLDELMQALDRVVEQTTPLGAVGQLYADRAAELLLEARLVESLGTAAFRRLAARRFATDLSSHGRRADEWAAVWRDLEAVPEPATTTPLSDDASHPASLLSVLRQMLGAHRLPVRVVVRADLASAAASGDGLILIRSGARYGPREARRIALHEIAGHILPRHRAGGHRIGLLVAGTAGSSADEEGRALLIEQRSGLMGAQRCRALALRHEAARSVREGADWVDTMALLTRQFGAAAREAAEATARAHRGGGLAREVVYLPALARVSQAFEVDPGLEQWLEAGRASLDAARLLRGMTGLIPSLASDERSHQASGPRWSPPLRDPFG